MPACLLVHLCDIILLQIQLGELGVTGVLALAPQQAGPCLGLQQVQEGSIAAWPPIQTAEVCCACRTHNINITMCMEACVTMSKLPMLGTSKTVCD